MDTSVRGDESGYSGLGTLARLGAFAVLFLVLLIGAYVALGAFHVPLAGPFAFLETAATLVAALTAGWLVARWLDGRTPAALGFAWTARTMREIGVGLAIGVIAILVAIVPLVAAGWIRYTSEAGSATSWAGVAVRDFGILGVAAAAEESLFRGYPFQVLVRAIGAPVATILASAVFALAHRANPNASALALVNIGLAGVLLSAAYLRTHSLWFATAVHLGWNWGMATLLDLPVSGIEWFETPLYEPVIDGPPWVSGGTFGPEGGVAASLAFGLALVTVLRLRGLDPLPATGPRRPIIAGSGEVK